MYVNAESKSAVLLFGHDTVLVRFIGSNDKRMTVCVSIASDETKLRLFLIFRSQRNERIKRSLKNILPSRVYGCFRSNGVDGCEAYEAITRPSVEVLCKRCTQIGLYGWVTEYFMEPSSVRCPF